MQNCVERRKLIKHAEVKALVFEFKTRTDEGKYDQGISWNYMTSSMTKRSKPLFINQVNKKWFCSYSMSYAKECQ